jgi:hypothetical protein
MGASESRAYCSAHDTRALGNPTKRKGGPKAAPHAPSRPGGAGSSFAKASERGASAPKAIDRGSSLALASAASLISSRDRVEDILAPIEQHHIERAIISVAAWEGMVS